jgi:hypothetical protein
VTSHCGLRSLRQALELQSSNQKRILSTTLTIFYFRQVSFCLGIGQYSILLVLSNLLAKRPNGLDKP